MPGEFGSYQPGWFWVQVENSALDLASGKHPLTQKWGQFFRAFTAVAKAVSCSETGDSSPDDAVLVTMKRLPELTRCLADVENYVRRCQAEEAVIRPAGEGGAT
jgi:hypothetical protein